MFLLNSCLSLFSAARPCLAPFLPKLQGHFAEFLDNASPPALGFSPHPPVGLRYGCMARDSGFSWQPEPHTSLLTFGTPHSFGLPGGFSSPAPPLLAPVFPFPGCAILLRPTVLMPCSAGISTCCPSATPSGLALGPDLPRADQLYPGTLGYRPGGFPPHLATHSGILPPCLSTALAVLLRPCRDAPLPTIFVPRLRRRVSAPDIFGAGPLG